MTKEYTADTIKSRDNLQFIREEPAGLVGSRDVAGLIHVVKEIIDNSVDEMNETTMGGLIRILLLRDTTSNRVQFVVQDFGRGIPSASLKDTMARTGTSGKTEVGAFKASGGQFGWGAKVPAALSKNFRVLSSNYKEHKLASVTLHDGIIVDNHAEKDTSKQYGVITVFEIDIEKFFDQVDVKNFIVFEWMELINLCKTLNIFNDKALFEIATLDTLIPDTYWTCTNVEARDTVTSYLTANYRTIHYQASEVVDKSEYLFELWKRTSPLVFSKSVSKIPTDTTDRLGFKIHIYASKKSATGNPQFFITVNNIRLLDTTGNSATIAFMTALRTCIASYYTDEPKYQDFVMDTYRFTTLYLAIGISYDRAKLAGMTKESFKDLEFYNQFLNELGNIFKSDPSTWEKLALAIRGDVEYRYAQYYDTPVSKSEDKKVIFRLNYNDNYKACYSFDSSKTELFIVEGTSAGNIIDNRDNDFQAVYTTLGKPYNGATRYESIEENRARLLRDPIYQDLLQILNINEKTKNMSACRFNKLIITTDADPDGYHICSLHINNLYIINPLIITSGLVWIANPPLYSMDTRGKKSNKLFLRNKTALMDARIEFLYQPSIELRTISNYKKETILELSPQAYRDACYMVNMMGEIMNTVATRLDIPLLILERLALGVEYLCKTPIDLTGLSTCFRSCDKYCTYQTYDQDEVLLVSMGDKDYPIGLKNIGQLLREYVLPAMVRVRYFDYNFLVRSKHPGSSLSEWTRMSMMQVYLLFQQLDGLFPIHRYKGLGELDTADCATTLLNTTTRALTHVTSIGDVEDNYALLGTDTTGRKNLLLDTAVLDRRFQH